MKNLIEMLIRHEGKKPRMYLDTKGIPTIGVGRNVRDVGLSDDEITYLLKNDIATVAAELRAEFPWFTSLSPTRQDALVDMCFMGVARFKTFHKTVAAFAVSDFESASREMMNSEWAKEVGERANVLSEMIRTDSYR